WHWASAPSRPPRLAPSPSPTLVTKKLIGASCPMAAGAAAARSAAPAAVIKALFMNRSLAGRDGPDSATLQLANHSHASRDCEEGVTRPPDRPAARRSG